MIKLNSNFHKQVIKQIMQLHIKTDLKLKEDFLDLCLISNDLYTKRMRILNERC